MVEEVTVKQDPKASKVSQWLLPIYNSIGWTSEQPSLCLGLRFPTPFLASKHRAWSNDGICGMDYVKWYCLHAELPRANAWVILAWSHFLQCPLEALKGGDFTAYQPNSFVIEVDTFRHPRRCQSIGKSLKQPTDWQPSSRIAPEKRRSRKAARIWRADKRFQDARGKDLARPVHQETPR